MTEALLEIRGADFGYEGRAVVSGVDVQAWSGTGRLVGASFVRIEP